MFRIWFASKHKKKEAVRTSLSSISRVLTGQEQAVGINYKKTVLAELKKCSSTRNLKRGQELHAEVTESGNFACIYVSTALLNMYARCGSMVDARQVFDSIKHPDVASWNALILGYAENREGVNALKLYARMRCQGFTPNSITFVAALKACTSLALNQDENGREECRERGKEIHSSICSHSNIYVQNTLIDMYAKSGSMSEAHLVFEAMEHPDVVSWNTLILGYAENGMGLYALDLFTNMKTQGFSPNSITFVAVIKACTSLALKKDESGKVECMNRGKQIHLEIGGFHLTSYVQTTLIDMYTKCGCMANARQVFNTIKNPDVVSWTSLIMGYAENGEGVTALNLFAKMRFQGCAPNSITFIAALKACTSLALKRDESGKAACLEQGKKIHLSVGCSSDIFLNSTLIDMYAKCGGMTEARHVFDSMKHANVVSWNALLLGYAEKGEGGTALNLFAKMRSQGRAPDSVTFVAVLKACGFLGALESGRRIHAQIDIITEHDATLVTCLVDFYAKCGSLVEAQKVFDAYPRTRDLRTWTALLAGYGFFGDDKAAFRLFEGMQDAGFRPDCVTFLCILSCCSHAGFVEKANHLFEAMSTNYRITPNIEHYNCMIDILGRSNKLDDALNFLRNMPCKPNAVTWMTVLAACRKWKNVKLAMLAFKSLLRLDGANAAGYVLMAHIYGSIGMSEEKEMMLGIREKFKGCKEPEQSCWTNDVGEVHIFCDGNSRHSQIDEIQKMLKHMAVTMQEQSINYNTNAENEDAFCSHNEKLAIACALINSKPGQTIRIVKNHLVCDNCHYAIALISKLENRAIICSDAIRCHAFKDGKCVCGDFW